MSVVLNLVATVVVKLFKSVVLAFKLIRLDKAAVSAFCNKKAVSVIFNLVATVVVKLFKFVVFAFKLILLDKPAVSDFCNK